MELNSFKAAIIKRARNKTEIDGGRVVIYPDVTFVYPDGKSELFRNVLISEYIDGLIVLKKPYYFFVVPVTLPVSFMQAGYVFACKANCLFAIYDGKDMREDVKIVLKHIASYRKTVMLTAIAMIFLGITITTVGGVWLFLGIILISWFSIVLLFSLFLSIERIENEMQDATDLDRIRFTENASSENKDNE